MRDSVAAAVMAVCVGVMVIQSESWLPVQCKRSGDAGSVVSQPGAIASVFEHAIEASADFPPRVLSTDPFVLAFHAFASEDECDELVKIFNREGGTEASKIGALHAGRTLPF